MVISPDTFPASRPLADAMVRAGKDADRVDGVKPRLVIEPRSAGGVAEALAWAVRERISLVIRGGGTRLAWGRCPESIDVVLGMRGVNRVLAHAEADLTATVEAGATIEEVNAALGRSRQWLPIDAPDGATIGGAIATNDSGPLRHRYGTPRDLLIGIELAMTDGRLVKAGGNVVKNVAGYDLGRLMSGSFGGLAAIVSATFKLLPVPASFQTLIATFQDLDAAVGAVTRLNDSQLEPTSLELHATHAGRDTPPYKTLARFGGTPAGTAAQAAAARALIGAGEIVSGDPEAAAWRRYVSRWGGSAGTIVGMNWLPAALPRVLRLVEDLAQQHREVEFVGRAGAGAGQLRVDGAIDWQASVVERLRAGADVVTHVTIRDAPPAVKQMVDAWGPPNAATALGRAVKQVFDPVGVLNAGRGPI